MQPCVCHVVDPEQSTLKADSWGWIYTFKFQVGQNVPYIDYTVEDRKTCLLYSIKNWPLVIVDTTTFSTRHFYNHLIVIKPVSNENGGAKFKLSLRKNFQFFAPCFMNTKSSKKFPNLCVCFSSCETTLSETRSNKSDHVSRIVSRDEKQILIQGTAP